MSIGTIGSPGLTFSGKMYSKTGATYCQATSPFATFGALLKHSSSATWPSGPAGVQSVRTATLIVRDGWLSNPAGAFVARILARSGCGPVFCVVMPPLGDPVAFSPVISNGMTTRRRLGRPAGSLRAGREDAKTCECQRDEQRMLGHPWCLDAHPALLAIGYP